MCGTIDDVRGLSGGRKDCRILGKPAGKAVHAMYCVCSLLPSILITQWCSLSGVTSATKNRCRYASFCNLGPTIV